MSPHTSTGSPACSQGEPALPKEQKARQAGICRGARVLFASEQTWQLGPSLTSALRAGGDDPWQGGVPRV